MKEKDFTLAAVKGVIGDLSNNDKETCSDLAAIITAEAKKVDYVIAALAMALVAAEMAESLDKKS